MIKPHTRGGSRSALQAIATRMLALSVLVSMIASLAIATPVMAADTVAATTDTVAAAPVDVAQANPFSDVPENSWAYDAVRQLAAAGLVTGYPDNTFKGNRPMTRYEMAVLINRAVNAIQSKIAQAGAGAVKQSDLDAIKRLIDAFRPELAQVQAALRALQAQVAANTSATTALKAQNDQISKQLTADEAVLRATAASVTAGSIHPKFWDRSMTYNQFDTVGAPGYGFAYGGAAGAGVIANPATLSYGTLGGQGSIQTAQIGRSTNFQTARLDVGGAPDPRIQWGIRIEAVQKWSGTIDNTPSASAPGYCTNNTGLNCGIADYGGGAWDLFASGFRCPWIGS